MPKLVATAFPRSGSHHSASARRGAALALAACVAAPSTLGFVASSGPGLFSAAAARRPALGTQGAEAAAGQWAGKEAPSATVDIAPAPWAGILASGSAAGALAAVAGKQRRQQRASIVGSRAEAGNAEEDVPFEIRGFSLSYVALGAGIVLTVLSFLDYTVFSSAGSGLGLGGLGFIYSIPAVVLGLSLLYAEIPPIGVETESGAEGLFEDKATPTLRKIKNDITRHRYGDDAHLDTSLKALGLDGAARYPQLRRFIESKSQEGELEITMLFESRDVPFTTWSDPLKIVACDRFFGPGLWTEIYKHSSEKRIAALKLTTGPRPERAPSPASRPTPMAAAAS